MQEAISFHIEGLVAEGLPVPAAGTVADVKVMDPLPLERRRS